MDNSTSNGILENLNSDQLEAVTSKQHPIIIIAGAGSGKTRVLTRRIAHRIATSEAEARHTLAITFTKKAANELKSRLNALQLRDHIEAHTFHAAALKILQRYWESQHMAPFDLLDSKFRVVSDAISSLGSLTRDQSSYGRGQNKTAQLTNSVLRKSLVSSVVSEIEWAKARGLSPQAYQKTALAQNRSVPLTPSEISEIFQRYEQLKSKMHKLDYDDLITQATWSLNSDPTFAKAERYRVRHLYIDEFQDVNTNQMNLVNALLGDRTDLCVVGDPNQAIYAWNGADPTLLASLSERFKSAKTVVLSRNYRSTPQILALASGVLRSNKQSSTDTLLIPQLQDGPIPVIRSFKDEKHEAQAVARLAKIAHQPSASWSDIAVLARTNSQLVPLQSAFRDLGIPAFISGETNYLSQDEIRVLLTSLERGATPLRGASLYSWIEEIISRTIENYNNNLSAVDNLGLFLELSREFLSQTPHADSRALALWLKTEAQSSTDQSVHNAVTLATFHKAKGLEWRSVFLVGLEDGYVPIARAENPQALAEEQRLLYVAITRAKREITLTWARQRHYNERQLRREPSPYLTQLQYEIAALSGHIATSEHALNAISKVRKTLETTAPGKDLTDAQKSTLELLRLWRSDKSKELGVPPHMVLHDYALETVALNEPLTLEALAKIAGVGQIRAARFGNAILECVKR